jgi:quercetin dioxygenase-like cupin family protein
MTMKTKVLALAVLCALVTAVTSFAASPPIVAKAIAVGKMQATTIRATSGAMILETYTVKPGGSFGWHVHGAPVAVVVTAGTLTVFDPKVNGCTPFKVSKGASFVEPANHVHLARNDGTKPATVYALYLGVPKASDVYVQKAEPAGCNA